MAYEYAFVDEPAYGGGVPPAAAWRNAAPNQSLRLAAGEDRMGGRWVSGEAVLFLPSTQDSFTVCIWPHRWEYKKTSAQFAADGLAFDIWTTPDPAMVPLIVRPYMCLEVHAELISRNDQARVVARLTHDVWHAADDRSDGYRRCARCYRRD